MATPNLEDSLHRLIKHAIDSGTAASVGDAEAMFRGYRLRVEIDPVSVADPVQQAALLTTVALARRVFPWRGNSYGTDGRTAYSGDAVGDHVGRRGSYTGGQAR